MRFNPNLDNHEHEQLNLKINCAWLQQIQVNFGLKSTKFHILLLLQFNFFLIFLKSVLHRSTPPIRLVAHQNSLDVLLSKSYNSGYILCDSIDRPSNQFVYGRWTDEPRSHQNRVVHNVHHKIQFDTLSN